MTESHKLSYGSSRTRRRNRKCQKKQVVERLTKEKSIRNLTQKKTDTPQRVWLHRLKFTYKHTWIQWQNDNNIKHKQNNKHTSILLAHTLIYTPWNVLLHLPLLIICPPNHFFIFLNTKQKTTTNGHNKLLDLQINNNNNKRSSHSNCHSNRRWLRQFVIRSLSPCRFVSQVFMFLLSFRF